MTVSEVRKLGVKGYWHPLDKPEIREKRVAIRFWLHKSLFNFTTTKKIVSLSS